MGALWLILADLSGLALCLLGGAFFLGSILPKFGGSSSDDGLYRIVGLVLMAVGIVIFFVAGMVF